MNDAGHSRWEEDLPAYALDALSPDEAREVEAHLADCERCRAELRWLEPAVDVLAESVAQVSPPPRLREELLAVTRSESRQAEHKGWRSRWRGWMTRPATAIAVTAVVAAGIAGYALRGGDEPAPAGSEVAFEAVLERHGDSGTLRVSNVPEVEGGVYQVWIQHGDRVRPSSAFRPDPDGTAVATIPADLAGADAVMVTHEPERGRTQPSSDPLFETDLD